MSIRLVVCIDFETDNLDKAYQSLQSIMGAAPSALSFEDAKMEGWETSDEWYPDSQDGAGDPGILQEAISRVLGTCPKCGSVDYDTDSGCESCGRDMEGVIQ